MTKKNAPHTAMILGAGFGKRLLPITETCPKPLVKVGRRTLLDHILDHLEGYGIQKTVINTYHLREKIVDHFQKHPRHVPLIFSHEEVLLDTGGGVKHVLKEFDDKFFFIINGDVLWKDSKPSCFELLAKSWIHDFMDVLLLLIPLKNAWGYENKGDFFREKNGTLKWREGVASAPYVFSGIQLIHPRCYKGIPDMVFSNHLAWEKAREKGRLYGVVWDGSWYHIGTPAAFEKIQTIW